MNMIVRRVALVLFAAAPLVAGAQSQGNDGNRFFPGRNPNRCSVSDLTAFRGFIAGKPTPAEFHTTYSCVTLVLPGDFSSREMRADNSRYFADLDTHGRIVGGHFQ